MLNSKPAMELGILLFLSGVVYVLLGYFTIRADFEQLIFLYSIVFVFYFFIYRICVRKGFFLIPIVAAILFHVSMLFFLPNFSDDFFRFVWDGQLSLQGINPYHFLPSEIMTKNLANVEVSLFEHLNSQNYYSVYPPASQAVFFISSFLFPENVLGNVVVLKVFMLLFEFGTIFLLCKLVQFFQLKKETVLLYALNPLVIVELTGNIHFEAGMIFFTLMAISMAIRGNVFLSASSLALAIMIKLLPLIFIPYFYRQFGGKHFFKFSLYLTVLLLLFLFPLWDYGLVKNFMASVSLYFNHFSFNASLYYIARWLTAMYNKYELLNHFGILSFVFLSVITIIFLLKRKKENHRWLFSAFLFPLTIYFLFATTVHPWYITPLIAFTLFTNFRFPIIWSALIPLTYITYSTLPYHENLFLIGLEYLIVTGFFTYEVFSNNLTINRFSNKNN